MGARRCAVTTLAAFAGWALVLVIMLAPALVAAWAIRYDVDNGSTDGRRHTCGFVTEQGVTEHLAKYAARCGQVTP